MFESLSSQFNCDQVYLNTATAGLGCNSAIEAMQNDLQGWMNGQLRPKEYDVVIDQCRTLFAGLVGAKSDEVAIANQASTSVGTIASSLPAGSKVLAAEGDFTSVLFPLMVQQSRGVDLTLVPLEHLIESISSDYDWVACSAVQSSNGHVLDLDRLAEVTKSTGCRILLDATQSAGWMPIKRKHWDVLVCGAYKWLLSPRGTAFMAVKPELYPQITPINANWYAGDSPWDAIYGSPLRLASSAKQFDISPAWINWVGTLPALELISSIGIDAIYQHNVGLANLFCQRMGLPETNSAIVSLENVKDEAKLEAAGIVASIRGGGMRLSFHLYNDARDVDAIVKALF